MKRHVSREILKKPAGETFNMQFVVTLSDLYRKIISVTFTENDLKKNDMENRVRLMFAVLSAIFSKTPPKLI